MKTFKEYMTEVIAAEFKEPRIATNPSKRNLESKLKREGELRYLHNNKTNRAHVGSAEHFIHQDIADHAGEHDFKRVWDGENDWDGAPAEYTDGHFHAGYVNNNNIEKIKAHPDGLTGYIRDFHKNMV